MNTDFLNNIRHVTSKCSHLVEEKRPSDEIEFHFFLIKDAYQMKRIKHDLITHNVSVLWRWIN